MAVKEVENFAFLKKIEKQILDKSGLSLCFGCFLIYFWTRSPKKHHNELIMPIFYISEVFIFKKKLLMVKAKIDKNVHFE